MTTGEKFRFHGVSAGNRALVLAKEIELLALEISSHKEVIGQLLAVMDLAALTPRQAREITAEIEWRRHTIRKQAQNKKHKQRTVLDMAARQRMAQLRMQQAQQRDERKAA